MLLRCGNMFFKAYVQMENGFFNCKYSAIPSLVPVFEMLVVYSQLSYNLSRKEYVCQHWLMKMHICYILCILHEIHSLTLLVPGGVVSSASLIARAGLCIQSLGTAAARCSLLAHLGLTQVGVYVSLGGLHIQGSKVKLFPFHLWAMALSHHLACFPETP